VSAEARARERARDALARLEKAASRVRCLDLVLYRSARAEAVRRGDPIPEHAPGVPAADPAEQPPIAAVLRGEAWLTGGRPGGWPGLVGDLHWELMQGRDPVPGALRTGESWVGGPDPAHARGRFPDPRSVPRLLAAFDRALRAEPDPLVAAATAYARVGLIHPFRDGNGRVAQALAAVVLRERGVLSRPSFLLGPTLRARRRAHDAVMDLLLAGDARPGLPFFLRVLEGAATEAAATCDAIGRRFEADERRLRGGAARRLLSRLAEGALPVREVGEDRRAGLRALQDARIAKVVPGLFDEPMLFHVGLARIVAGGPGSGRVSSGR
jgi:hypothetical protein